MLKKERNKCICCGNYTLIGEKEDIIWLICPVCYWENDISEECEKEYSNANHMTLIEAQQNYARYHACNPKLVEMTRSPLFRELPVNNAGKKY